MDSILFEEIISKLKDEGLISYFDLNSAKTDPSQQVLTSLLDEVKLIHLDDGELVYTDESGDAIKCPHVDTSVSDCGWWLSSKIPSPNFDIQQSGNIRKAEEAEAAYICAIITAILNDAVFAKEFKDLMKEYDFKIMSGDNTFAELLSSWQDLQSTTINVIVSAAKYSITNQKKDSESFLIDGITREEEAGLRDLALNIKQINFSYSTGVLAPERIKHLNKIERLQLIDERNVQIDNLIIKSKYSTLYKITKLSSEYVSPIMKKKIAKVCSEQIEQKYSSSYEYLNTLGEKNIIIQKVKKRALKLACMDVKRRNIEKYISDRDGYVLPRKQ